MKHSPRNYLLFALLVLTFGILTASPVSASLTVSNGMVADLVLGQADFTSNSSATTQTGMSATYAVAIDPTTGKVFVADQGNHRVLRFASVASLNNGAAAEAVLGQSDFTSNSSATTQNGMSAPRGVFVDANGRLWVSEVSNNRVLRFDNASSLSNGANANGVLGQPNFTSNSSNTTQSGMWLPEGIFVDSAGRLWVADSNNNRVLRFDNAASKSNGANADGVLGQGNFTSRVGTASQSGMYAPYGVHVDSAGRLWVADHVNHRLLRFDNAAAKANGANADGVLGQPDFTSNAYVTTQSGMWNPTGVTGNDSTGQIFLADRNNNRVLVFDNAAAKSNGANADNVIGQADFTSNISGISATTMNNPYRIFFDPSTEVLWVADTGNNRALMYGTPASSNPDITTGLIAHYAFEDNANDSSGNNYHGTPSNVTYAAGQVGQAAQFNNSSSKIEVSSLAGNLPGGNSARSVAFWVNRTASDNGNMVSWGANANTQRYSVLHEGNGQLRLIGQFADYSSSYYIPTSTWTHVVVTYDSSTLRYYVNGSLNSTSSAGSFNTDAAQMLRIGVNVVGRDDEYFGGALDEIRIYDRELSAADVTELYNYTSSVQYTLTTATAGNGSGSITLDPAGGTYDPDTVVTVTQSADTGSTFTGWSGACTGTGACVVTMDAAKSVTATFTLNQYDLTTATNGTGSGSLTLDPAGGNYNYGTVVSIIPSADVGSEFTGWSGACSGTGACNVTMDAAKSVTATFNLKQYNLTTATAGNGSGSITLDPAGGTYVHGTVVTLTQAADTSSIFTGWSGACTGTGACVVTMDAAKSVTATFTLKQYDLTTATDGSGSGSLTFDPAGGTYNHGTVVNVIPSADTGSEFTGWSGACSGVAACAVTMDAAKSVTATFTLKQYDLTTATDGNGTGSLTLDPAGGTYVHGTAVTVTHSADTGSAFTGWSGACTGTGDCVVTMDSAKSVTATFALSDITTGLIAHYAFDANADDSSGNNYHGTPSNVTYASGQIGQAAQFNNSSSKIEVASLANNLPGGNSARSVGFWIYPTTNDNGNMVSWGAAANNQRFSVLHQADRDLAIIGQFNDTSSGQILPINTWTHVVVTYDGTNLRFYTNGSLASTSSPSSYNTDAAQILRIGVNAAGAENEFFGGALDELRVYNRELSAADVAGLYSYMELTLTTATAGNGSGSIALDPAGGTYDPDTVVTVTQSADTGSTFTGWSGACSGTGACVVTMDAAKTVTAAFTLNQYDLTTATDGTGSGSLTLEPAGGTYDHGTVVTVTPTADTGSTFTGWSGACTGTGACVVTMDTAKSVTATFTLNQYDLTTATDGNGSGSVTLDPAGGTYDHGTVITVTQSANTGSAFTGWSGACTGTGACVTTMDAAKSITATFTLNQYDLTTATDGNGSGSLTLDPAGGTYDHGTVVTVTQSADTGSTFTGWAGACLGTGACVVTMDAAKSVTATFTLNQYDLTTATDGSGSGSLALDPAGGTYDHGTAVTITPTADTGSTFTGWSGACTGTGACVVTMDAAKSVTATFTINQYDLTTSTDGNGSGSIALDPASGPYDHGTVVTLTPTANTGSTFTGWSGACTGTGACVVTMDAAKSVNATFTLNQYDLTTATDGTGSGSVTLDPAGGTYDHGTVVTVTPSADTGSTFTGWSGACTGTGACVVTMDAAKSVTATFTLNQYDLTTATDGNGSGSLTLDPAGGTYDHGTVVTVTQSANTDSTFAGWSGACTGTGVCVITMDAAKSVTATFTLKQYDLTTAIDGNGSGSLTLDPAGGTYDHGTVVTVTHSADTGSTFTGWSGACTGTGACVVTMDAAKSVTATFTLNQYDLTTATDGTGSGSLTIDPAGGTYDHGTVVTVTQSADTGSTFTGWSGACTGTGACVVTMDAAKSVTATFTLNQYDLTTATEGNGSGFLTLDPAGGTYDHGTVVTVTYVADTGSTFTGWSGACTGSGACVVTMDAAKSVTATFTLNQYTLTTAADGTGSGTVTLDPAGGTYDHGTVVTVTHNADVDSTFTGWSGACSGTGACVVTMDAAKSVTATFTFNQYDLTTATDGNGSGSITLDPAGGTYDHGTVVTVTYSANTGSTFTGWSGACTGTGACVVTMDAAKSVTATFTLNQYDLTTATDGNGAGSLTLDPIGGTYDYGTAVTITQTADTGSTFTGWSGACTGTGACVVTMDAAKSVTATFTLNQYNLTTATDGSGTGSLTLDPAGGTYNHGTVVTITPNATVDSTFTGWSGACTGTGACAVTMDAAKSVTATFTFNQYDLTTATDGNGSGSIDLDPAVGPYDHGTVVTLTATADTYSTFTGWSGACSGTGTCVLTMDAAKSVTATFTLDQYDLTTAADGNGSGSLTLDPVGGTYDHGTVVTITQTADTGSTFTGWSGACTGTGACVVTMDAAKSVTATFTLNQYDLTTATDGNGSGSITLDPAGGTYDHGTIVTLTATADTYSNFTGWSGACSGTGSCVVTMDAAKSVTATFTLNQYDLTTATDGNGSGSVILDPAGGTYDHGTVVTVTHSADVGATFTGWGGACSGTGDCVVTMDAAKSVTATFTLNQYDLTTATAGNGSGSLTLNPAGGTYDHGTAVTITPSADTGSVFTGWSGACSGIYGCVVTMDAAKSVTATFTLGDITTGLIAHYAFEGNPADVSGNDYHGTPTAITSAPGPEGQAAQFDTYASKIEVASLVNNLPAGNSARSVAFWVYPASYGDTMVSWGTDQNNEQFSIALDGSGELFIYGRNNETTSGQILPLNTWTHVAITYNGNYAYFYIDGLYAATGYPSPYSTNAGHMLRIGAVPGPSSNGSFTGKLDELRIYDRTLASADVMGLYHYDHPEPSPLTIEMAGDGSGTVTLSPPSGPYAFGTYVNVTATPNADSYFYRWSGDCSYSGDCWVLMNEARSVTASFTLRKYNLSTYAPGGTITADPPSPYGNGTYGHGDIVTITQEANAGYTFTGWSGACTGTGACVITMDSYKNVRANYSVLDTRLTSTPPNVAANGDAGFSFTSDNANVTFECKMDTEVSFTACTSPKEYSGLPGGTRTFQVRAKDAAGQVDTTPASYTWGISTIRSVSPTGADSGDCTAAHGACRTIAYALNQAFDGDTVQIAAGTYKEYNLRVTKSITIQGAEGAANTVVDAERKGYGFSIISSKTVTISGLTIQNATNSGIYNSGSTLTLNNSTFIGNYGGYGGGIYHSGSSPLTLNNCTFDANAANYGGGIYHNSRSTLTINNSTFSANRAARGGGIYNNYGSVKVNNSTFNTNSAYSYEGGGIYNNRSGSLMVANSIFDANNARIAGGGIFNYMGAMAVDNSTFNRNQSTYHGGGIANMWTYKMVTIDNSTFTANSAIFGGGIKNSGSLTVNNNTFNGNKSAHGSGIFNESRLTVNNSIFSGNVASFFGSGIRNSGILTVNHSTFSRNRASYGGGIGNWNGSLTINSSIIWENIAYRYYASSGIYTNRVPSVNTSVLQYGTPIGTGTGNKVNQYPHFIRMPFTNGPADYGDLHLKPNSPARNMVTTCSGTDINGIVRTAPCDAGAYAYAGVQIGASSSSSQSMMVMGGYQQLSLAAAQTTLYTFTSDDGDVTLEIPNDAVTEPTDLVFSQGQVVPNGDGRAFGFVVSAYNESGDLLPADFTFQKAMTVTMAYSPTLVTNGPELSLMPIRYNPATEQWEQFTSDVLINTGDQNVTFPTTQTGEYALRSIPPAVYAGLTASTPTGVSNLAGGTVVTYTLTAQNTSSVDASNLVMSHTLPAGLTFDSWVSANGAAENSGVIEWNIASLAANDELSAIFTAQISSDAQYQGETITSLATLTGSDVDDSAEAQISVNAPPTLVDDDVDVKPETAATIFPLNNDENPDGSSLLITGVGTPSKGTAVIINNSIVYTPTVAGEFDDTFSYTVQDGSFSSSGTINAHVTSLTFLDATQLVKNESGVDISSALEGQTVIYEIDLSNFEDGDAASNAVMSLTLPAEIQFTNWITQSGATINGDTITWQAATMAKGDITTISFQAKVVGTYGDVAELVMTFDADNADVVETRSSFSIEAAYQLFLPVIGK